MAKKKKKRVCEAEGRHLPLHEGELEKKTCGGEEWYSTILGKGEEKKMVWGGLLRSSFFRGGF